MAGHSASKIELTPFDDLFQTDEGREDLQKERLTEIPLEKIRDFPDHPYQVKDDENMTELVESVKTYGLLQPVLVRPLEDGTFEMVSGHRRKRAFELAGFEKIPARVKELTRDEAILMMVDSNLQRDEILPSKKAKATKKAAKRSEEAARQTAKVAIRATKAAIKATIEGIKAAIAAAKELIAAAAAGSPFAIAIIIILALAAAIGGSCFGIFLLNDESMGTQVTISEAIPQLTTEHYAHLTNLKSGYDYDSTETTGGSMTINWREVLSVYMVKTTTSTDDAYEVTTLNDIKMDLLRDVIDDMNQITAVVVPTVVAETVTQTDDFGHTTTTTKYVTKNVLHVTILSLSADQISELYRFNDEQKEQLNELLSDKYDDLWKELIGSAGASGDILITNSTYIPTDIFTWPLQNNGNLTSVFGYRHDPKTREWKLHGGTDIAAPTGTPILASADGVVIAAQWHDSYGYYVKIQHNDTFATLYGHCSALHVSAGQQVKQ